MSEHYIDNDIGELIKIVERRGNLEKEKIEKECIQQQVLGRLSFLAGELDGNWIEYSKLLKAIGLQLNDADKQHCITILSKIIEQIKRK